MILSLAEAVWLGFIIAAVPGPVLFETIRRALVMKSLPKPFLAGNFIGIAAIMTISLLGFSLIDNPAVSYTLNVFNGLLLLYLGVATIVKKPSSYKKVESRSRIDMLTGFTLAVVNPIRIAFWVTLAAHYNHSFMTVSQSFVYGFCILMGSITFYVILVAIVRMAKMSISSHVRLLSNICGIILSLYGLFMIVKALF